MTLQLRTCKQRIDCRWRWVGVAHIVMWSVPLRDWLALEAAGSSLGWAEPMAWQGGVLGLPGQQVKQSGESKALHTHTHTHTHLFQGHMTGIQTENNNQARCAHTRWVKVKEASKSVQKHCKGKQANKRESETQQSCEANTCKRSVTALSGKI